MSTGLIIASIYFAISQIMDCVTTHRALKVGLKEWHPWLQWSGKKAPIVMAVLGALVLAFAIFSAIVAPVPNAIVAFWFLLFFGTLRVAASINNVIKVRKVMRAK